jgi:hypothetical protein
MRKFYIPVKDTTIHSQFPQKNTGRDEILEVGKSTDGLNSVRSLVQFDTVADAASIANDIAIGAIPSNAQFDMKLFVARADDLTYGQVIEMYQVSESWVEGTGYFYQNTNVPYTASRNPMGGYFENDGATWRTRQSGSNWATSGSSYLTNSISYRIADPVVDMVVDVTTFIQSWLSGSVTDSGLLLKFPTVDEVDARNVGNIRFFSRNTHTIYTPLIIAKWNDQQYITGSLTASNAPAEITVIPRNLRPRYLKGQVARVDLSVRDQYPVRTFDTAFTAWDGVDRLPSSSYFSVIDQQSNTTIIPFDQYSLVSCDGTGSYVKFRTDALWPGRYYKLMFKVDDQGYEQIFDSAHTFMVDAPGSA